MKDVTGTAKVPTRSLGAARIGGQTLIIFAGNLFTLLAGLPFQIYLTQKLGAVNVGWFGLAEAVVSTTLAAVSLGVTPTVLRFIPDHLVKGEHGAIRVLVGGATLVLLAVGSAGATGITVLASWLSESWLSTKTLTPVLTVLAWSAPISLMLSLYQQVLRSFERIAVLVIVSSVLMLSLKISLAALLFNLGWGLIGYAWATLISSLAALCVILVVSWRLIFRLGNSGTATKPNTRAWIRYAIVSYTGTLFDGVAAHLDRYLVGVLLGPANVAVLMIVKQLLHIPLVFHQAVLIVVTPLFASSTAARDYAQRAWLFHLAVDWVVRLTMPMAFFLSMYASPVLGLFGTQFETDGHLPLLIGLIGLVVNVGCGPLGALLIMAGEETRLLRFSVITATLNSAANCLLVPMLGLPGSFLAQLVSTVALNVAALVVARRNLFVPWHNQRVAGWLAPAIAALATLSVARLFTPAMDRSDGWSIAVLVLTLLLGYAAAILANSLQGFHDDDRALIATIVNKLGLRSLARAIRR